MLKRDVWWSLVTCTELGTTLTHWSHAVPEHYVFAGTHRPPGLYALAQYMHTAPLLHSGSLILSIKLAVFYYIFVHDIRVHDDTIHSSVDCAFIAMHRKIPYFQGEMPNGILLVYWFHLKCVMSPCKNQQHECARYWSNWRIKKEISYYPGRGDTPLVAVYHPQPPPPPFLKQVCYMYAKYNKLNNQ